MDNHYSLLVEAPEANLSRERVLANVGLAPGQAKKCAACVDGRVVELERKARGKELEAEWKRLRRG